MYTLSNLWYKWLPARWKWTTCHSCMKLLFVSWYNKTSGRKKNMLSNNIYRLEGINDCTVSTQTQIVIVLLKYNHKRIERINMWGRDIQVPLDSTGRQLIYADRERHVRQDDHSNSAMLFPVQHVYLLKKLLNLTLKIVHVVIRTVSTEAVCHVYK